MSKNQPNYFIAILLINLLLFVLITNIVQNSNYFLKESMNTNILDQDSSKKVDSKISAQDSRGYLTGRYFFGGFNDTDGDSLDNQLLIEVELNITEVSAYSGYIVRVDIYDPGFIRRVDDEFGFHWEEGITLHASSTAEMFSIGIHNTTVAFNCSYLRALKITGPYLVNYVELGEEGAPNWYIDSQTNQDNNYVYYIPGFFDFFKFDPLLDTTDMIFTNAEIKGDYVEINFTYTTFQHISGSIEDYYCHILLTNASGAPIVNHEEFFSLSSSSVYDLTLEIPSEYFGAFDQYGGFESSTPTLYFREVTMIQLTGYWDWMNMFNVSYLTEAFPTYSIDVSQAIATPYVSGMHNFGSLSEGEEVLFVIYPDSFDQIVKVQFNRTEPIDQWGPSFEYTFINGWGRWIDPWTMGSSRRYVMWNYWEMQTEITNFLSSIGKTMAPWLVHVHYPDPDPEIHPMQQLQVIVQTITDSTPPQITYDRPNSGDTFQQFYGIAFKGTLFDESVVTRFQIFSGLDLLFSYNPIESMNWGDSSAANAFNFVWFPPGDLTGTVELTVKAFDLAFNIHSSTYSITIQTGSPPDPDTTINKGLNWLRIQQMLDDPGSWEYGAWEYNPGQSSAGMTALAVLGFIQAGLAYEQTVVNGITFLKNSFEKDWDSSIPGKVIQQSGHKSYETAMATVALIAYNNTLPYYDSELSNLIDDAVAWLVYTQNDETWGVSTDQPWYGGWRYGDDHQSSDLSVSQWVILALATYQYEEPSFWDKVILFVERCRGGYWDDITSEFIADGGFTYTPSTQDWRDQGGGSYGSMTAAGIWGLFLSGVNPTNEYITSALDWINTRSIAELVGQNPYYGKSFEYYWYLTASKAFLMAGREQDQWWFDAITHYLNTHMIAESPTSAYWCGNSWDEPPIFATVQAILSQQVLYGEVPTETLEISLEAPDGAVLHIWNETIEAGYNYSTNQEMNSGALYSGILEKIQTITINSPTKGNYFLDIFPTTNEDGNIGIQQLILRAKALTESGHILGYKTKAINYQFSPDYPQILRYKMVVSTFSGMNILFLPESPPVFSKAVGVSDISSPMYVDIGQLITIDFSLTNLGTGTISSGLIYTISHLYTAYSSLSYVSWAQGDTQDLSFDYVTTGVTAGLQPIVIVCTGVDTNPIIIRLDIQVGNHAPTGDFDSVPSVISGTYILSWTATDQDEDDLFFEVILITPDGSEISLVSDLSANSYSFDSTGYPDDTNYQFKLKISDGIDTVDIFSSFFEVNNEQDDGPRLTPGFEVLISLIALLGFIYSYKRGNH